MGMRGRRRSAQDREGPQVKGEWPQAQPLLQVCGRASAALVEPDLGGGASSPLGTLTAGVPWRLHLLMSQAETKPTE